MAYSERHSEVERVDARVFEPFFGFAISGILEGSFSSVARGEGFVRWLEARADESPALSPAALSRVVGGARIGLDGLVRITDPLSLFIGAAGVFAAGSTDVTSHRRIVGSIPALSYELRAGLSLSL